MTQFKYDIFISYAHLDNQALTEEQQGWIDTLHRDLKLRLGMLLGEDPQIWRDTALKKNVEFNDEIIGELSKTAVLISVLSPRYIKSEWCVKEITKFAEVAEQTIGLRVENKSRIFKVVKTEIPLKKHPDVVRGILGYDFYDVDPDTRRPRELSRGFGPEVDRKYWARLDDLAYDIRYLLEFLRTKQSEADAAGQPDPPGALPPSSGGYTIYLAETTSDRRDERDKIRRELESHHHLVLPDRNLPIIGPELDQVVRENLARSDLAIHLIGETYGFVPEAAKNSAVEMQNTIAAKYSQQLKFGRLIWLPPDLEAENIDDERQQAFIEALQNDPMGAELFHTSIEELKTNIHQKLNPPEPVSTPEADPAAALAADGPPVVYLIFDPVDEDSIWDIQGYLIEQEIDVDLFTFDGDEALVRQEHQRSLKDCDAVLIYQGQASETWLKGKLNDVKKISGYGRVKPMLSQAVYLAPPKSARKEHFKSLQIDETIVNFDDFKPELLAPFIAKVKPAAEEA